jgi:hypothetical protein
MILTESHRGSGVVDAVIPHGVVGNVMLSRRPRRVEKIARCGLDGVAFVMSWCGTESPAPPSAVLCDIIVISHTGKRRVLYGGELF